jgi:acetyl esterase/lipase
VNPQAIGVLGFSAGGHLAAALSTTYSQRTYDKVDEADAVSCRPDFSLLIYPAYLTVKEQQDALAPELTITSNTPPTFLLMAQDDPIRVENVLGYSRALRQARVPFALHVYPSGGHGYGLRQTKESVTTWPARAEDWLRSLGHLKQRARDEGQ